MSEYGHHLEFDNEGLAVCPESGHKYRFRDGSVEKTG